VGEVKRCGLNSNVSLRGACFGGCASQADIGQLALWWYNRRTTKYNNDMKKGVMMEGRYGGMGWEDASPVDSLDLEANFAQIRGERQKAGGSTAERRAGLSPEQLAQAGQTLEEAREYFHGGLDALNNFMRTLPPEQQAALQQGVISLFEAAAYKLQDTKDAITPQ
jgi:hypothetical protein